jgi:hypothetical protein
MGPLGDDTPLANLLTTTVAGIGVGGWRPSRVGRRPPTGTERCPETTPRESVVDSLGIGGRCNGAIGTSACCRHPDRYVVSAVRRLR